jgi:integrator complex subunit 11
VPNLRVSITIRDFSIAVQVDDELEIRAYYAGHVLGAAMFYARVGDEVFGPSVLYTGDYNMTPDRHLGAAQVDRCRPDLLITEVRKTFTLSSDFAVSVRGSIGCSQRKG